MVLTSSAIYVLSILLSNKIFFDLKSLPWAQLGQNILKMPPKSATKAYILD